MANPVGQTLTRRRKRNDDLDEIRITGRVDALFTCVPAKIFAAPFTRSGPELAQQYNIKASQLRESESEQALARRLDIEATDRQAAYFGRRARGPAPAPHPRSPEGQFAATATAEADHVGDS